MIDNTSDIQNAVSTDITVDSNKKTSIGRLLKYAVFAIAVIFFAYSVTVYIIASKNVMFAEKYTTTFSAFFRKTLAYISCIFPFSVAETIVVAGIIFLTLMLVRAIVLRFVFKEKGRMLRYFSKLLCFLLLAASLFINSFGVCYKRHDISTLIGIDCYNISENDLLTSAYLCSAAASGFCGDISRLDNGTTVMPYAFDEMVRKIHTGYEAVLKDVPEVISVKPVALSKPWTYTHISGMYFPFTGESNVNVNYPDFVVAFSCAHEIAHQLGVANEDDANMMAFLALSYSGDSYLMYSAYVNALDYLISDLNQEDKALLMMTADRRIIAEFNSYSEYMKDYRNIVVSDLSAGLNNAYLKVNGVENGTQSYREVNKLICGFMKMVYPEFYGTTE